MRSGEGELDIRLGAPVSTRDGKRVGRVDRVVVDPDGERLTHLVVHSGVILTRDVVVPAEDVDAATRDGVRLHLGSEELDRLPDFVETEFVPLESQDEPPLITWEGAPSYEPKAVLVPASLLYDPPIKPYAPQIVEERENVPYGAADIAHGSWVRCVDGPVGKVVEVRVEPSTRRVTGVVVEAEDGRWLVPAEAIAVVDSRGVGLRARRCELHPAGEGEETEQAS